MRIVKFEKNSPEWLEFKRGKIGGSRAKASKPLSRGADRTPELFWVLVGELLTRKDNGQEPMQRGHTYESEAIGLLSKQLDLEFDDNPGVWIDDEDEGQILSPDGAQPGNKPMYSAEIKCLGSGKHFKYLYKWKHHEGPAIDAVPNESRASYREQCIDYFARNPDLLIHYFGMYNPDAIYEDHKLFYIPIERHEVLDLIEEQETTERTLLKRVRSIVDELVGDRF